MELLTRVFSFLAITLNFHFQLTFKNGGKFITIRINRIMNRLVFYPTIRMGAVKHHTGHFRVTSC